MVESIGTRRESQRGGNSYEEDDTMKNNTLVFNSYEAYENWTEQFDGCYEYEEIPTAIDDGWRISADLFTDCKSWKTAIRRFEKAFVDVNPEIRTWIEGIRESAESGYFKEAVEPAWNATPEERKEFFKGGMYSWGIEEVDEGRWYIFLNISGIYAGRERA